MFGISQMSTHNHPEKISAHPCQFPIELVERCVLSMTNEDDWVLDPYGGVGSTAIAALKHNRKVISIDRDKEFCEITDLGELQIFTQEI